MHASIKAIQSFVRQLESSGINYALGGSGLLYSLGLAEQVRDWDVTTEVPIEALSGALNRLGYAWEAAPVGDAPFASQYRLTLQAGRTGPDSLPIDLIGGFAIHSELGLCRLPCRSAARWEGLHMASPEIWAAAYALMGRQEKAELLYAYLRQHGARVEMIRLLLTEPLPPSIQSELERLPSVRNL